MCKQLLLIACLTFSLTSEAMVKYFVINNSSNNVTVEVKNSGQSTLLPGQNTNFSYENNTNPMWERVFSCRENKSYGYVECWLNNQLQAQVSPTMIGGVCKIEKTRMNQSIICTDQ